MEDSLYDTSWLLHRIPRLNSALSALLTPPATDLQPQSRHTERLSSHAELFLQSLSKDRPRYEDEEEKEKLGSLRECTWRGLQAAGCSDETEHMVGKKRKRDAQDDGHVLSRGLLISLIYEKKTYKFILYTTSAQPRVSKRGRPDHTTQVPAHSPNETAILLSKSSPSALKALTNYLSDTFALDDIHPLRLPSSFIQSTLETYLRSIYTSLSTAPGAGRRSTSTNLRDTIGIVKLTISFSAPVAPSLKSLEVAVHPHVVSSSLKSLATEHDRDKREFVMGLVSGLVTAKTGLRLPLLNEMDHIPRDDHRNDELDNHDPKSEPPMKLSRISNAAYVISSDQRLKFFTKAVDVVDGLDDGEGNVVRSANEALLTAMVDEAQRQGREKG